MGTPNERFRVPFVFFPLVMRLSSELLSFHLLLTIVTSNICTRIEA